MKKVTALRKKNDYTPERSHAESDFLAALGERVKALRARQGMSRKALSQVAGVSERHLANLEYGEGNASILVLVEIAKALGCSLAELTGDMTTQSPEWLMIRSLLEPCDEKRLRSARVAITKALNTQTQEQDNVRHSRIALIGMRGAGKSTLGAMLAEALGYPFVELSREIEQFAGCSVAEIQDLYGVNAYRRYERRALEETIQIYPEAIIGTPGGLVSDPVNFNLLLSHCTTIWLRAKPEEHMQRVMDQGDFRPMAGNREAMDDLKGILKSREAFYGRAQFQLDTSQQGLEETYQALLTLVNTMD